MIPKIIHYCWFGGKPLDKMSEKCIKSWKTYMPDYEIKRWDETNFDVNSIPYTCEAYAQKKYAFVSDYARLWILYNEGGIYFDTDVELIRPLTEIIDKGPFMGCDNEYPNRDHNPLYVNPGVGLGMNAGNTILKELIELYSKLEFKKINGEYKTIVMYTSEILYKYGMKKETAIQDIEGIRIYPKEYFSPICVEDDKLTITKNTYSIHHYAKSWQSKHRTIARKIILAIGGYRLKSLLRSLLTPKKRQI